jgi:mannan endo-1,4-beta-mannosidase
VVGRVPSVIQVSTDSADEEMCAQARHLSRGEEEAMRCHNLLRFPLALLAPLVLAACPTFVFAENIGFVSVSGDKFILNGVPFYYAGTNSYYQMVYAADLGLRPYVEEVQTETAGLGLTVLRTWAFNDGADEWNALQTSPGVYDEDIFVGLDYVLHLADQNGLRLILPFVNNWDDYGGMNQYVEWSGTASDHDDFYTDANCRTWYKNHVSTVLNRVNTFNSRIYREDPTIFAWELANEPRCESDPTGATLEAWVVEMSSYIKSVDPDHLVTTGSEGFYGPAGPAHNLRSWMSSTGCDFIPHHAVETIDFACVHDWGAHWGTSYAESMTWVRDHIDDSTDLLGKPVILEEFGRPRPTGTRDTFYQGWYDEVYSAAQAGDAAGGSNFWILYHDDYEDYDGFGVYYPEDTTTCAIIAAEAAKMNSLIVPNTSSTHTIQITSVSPGAERDVSIGSWYELSDTDGWTFQPETDTDHVELALYGSDTELAAGTTPFEQHQTRTSALWPDGPENESGELGYEVSPNVLGDNNQHLYGKPYYKSIRLYAGHLSPDSVYEVSFADSAPSRIWLHPLRSHYFTMSADILQSSELTNPVYGPASVSRTILSADLTRFEYSGLSPDNATGLKDDYEVGDYDQRPWSHGSGDFGWFPGYSLSFHNEGPGSVAVALFVNTGFTGPSGAPTNTLANDTFWKSDEIFISMGETATAKLDFDDVQGYSLSDNPFPHTAGDQSVPDGTAGVAVNIFDRLQVSAIGWEVRSDGGGRADASLIVTPRAVTVVSDTTAPTVTGVGIVNLTLGHTNEYAKDSDYLKLTATVADDMSTLTASDITADFSTLLVGGGSVVVAEDYTGTTATWEVALQNVELQGDELKTVTVTVTDGAGNTGTGTDQITVDNTPPTAVTGFAAAPGHNKADLAWSDASGTDSNFYEVIIRSNAWGGYPNYTGGGPVYPADAGDGTLVWQGTGTSHTKTYNSDNSERDIYYYGAFAVDMALNYGPADAGAQDRSTNYWLGDVANAAYNWIPDGNVSVADITKISGTYGESEGSPDFEDWCDVGPTDDGSRVGIPEPDDIVQYEDLMIFAMNYGAVSPRVVPFLPLPESTQELALSVEERSTAASGEVELSLVLSGNADEVKGLSAVLTYDTAELGFVSARLSEEMSSPLGDVFFWHGYEDGRIQLDLVVLGTDVTAGGSGEVAVLTFVVLSDEYGVEIKSADLRGAENRPLGADLEGFESSPELPVMFRLVQNVPNPFNPVTQIAYHVPQESGVSIRIYDVSGRLVRTLVDGVVKPGRHAAVWNGTNEAGESVGSGIYFCTMEAPDFHESRKMMLLK